MKTRNQKGQMRINNFKKITLKEEPKEIKSSNWFDKNKFKKILAVIPSKEFTYRNKIGEFKYDNIKDLVNNIRNNTISEIDAKKDLNTLNKIKNAEIIKYKKRTPGHKKLLNLFNDLSDIILTDKTLESESQENENEKVESRKEENEHEDYENKYENQDEDDYYENEDEDETMSQKMIKNLNDNLDEMIDKSKSFQDQIESLKILEDLKSICRIKIMMIKSYNLNNLKYNLQACKMPLTKSYLNKYLVIHL